MEENLINDDQLQQSFKQLKKFAKQVETDYNKLIDETFDENQWRKEGQKIKSNIKKFEKTLKELTNNVQNSKDNGTASQNTISKIDEELKKINQKEVGMIKAIREKIENYASFDENDNNNNQEENDDQEEQKQELVLDLMNNKEILEQRRKELQDIHKTSAMIKDTTEQMKQDLYKQGEILTNVEDNVFKTDENVEDAGKEILKANEYSKGNTKKLCCLIFIVIVVVFVAVAIVLSLVL